MVLQIGQKNQKNWSKKQIKRWKICATKMTDALEPAQLLLNFKNSAKKPTTTNVHHFSSASSSFGGLSPATGQRHTLIKIRRGRKGKKRLFNPSIRKGRTESKFGPKIRKRLQSGYGRCGNDSFAGAEMDEQSEEDSDREKDEDQHQEYRHGQFRYGFRSRPVSKSITGANWRRSGYPRNEESDETTSYPSTRMSRNEQYHQSVMQLPLSNELKESLRRLKNLLKLPKARRWVYCEFFYSDIDRELLLIDNEFRLCLRESFPTLRTRSLNRPEWRQIRRLIGKPRRCSQAFFDEERQVLEQKRSRIRDVYKGIAVTLEADLEIPSKIPRPLVVGSKVAARVHHPKDGIFVRSVDAVMDATTYRVVFERDVIPPQTIDDFDLVSEIPDELVPISFFLEKNRAAQPVTFRCVPGGSISSPMKLLSAGAQPITVSAETVSVLSTDDPLLALTRPSSGLSVDEKCGNYPLRSLVAMVKLSKLLEVKKCLLMKLQEMNAEAERTHLYAQSYLLEFQQYYAKVVIELEGVNREIDAYSNSLDEFANTLLPFVSDLSVYCRPETLKKLCASNASQMVKQCNSSLQLQVQSKSTLDLITSLTALLLQVRALGQQKCGAFELRSLSDAVNKIRIGLHQSNHKHFENHVEVHLRHIQETIFDGAS